MDAQAKITSYALLLSASLARDLDAAGLMSGTTRKALHNGLAEIRDEQPDEGEAGAFRSALGVLDAIPTAGSD